MAPADQGSRTTPPPPISNLLSDDLDLFGLVLSWARGTVPPAGNVDSTAAISAMRKGSEAVLEQRMRVDSDFNRTQQLGLGMGLRSRSRLNPVANAGAEAGAGAGTGASTGAGTGAGTDAGTGAITGTSNPPAATATATSTGSMGDAVAVVAGAGGDNFAARAAALANTPAGWGRATETSVAAVAASMEARARGSEEIAAAEEAVPAAEAAQAEEDVAAFALEVVEAERETLRAHAMGLVSAAMLSRQASDFIVNMGFAAYLVGRLREGPVAEHLRSEAAQGLLMEGDAANARSMGGVAGVGAVGAGSIGSGGGSGGGGAGSTAAVAAETAAVADGIATVTSSVAAEGEAGLRRVGIDEQAAGAAAITATAGAGEAGAADGGMSGGGGDAPGTKNNGYGRWSSIAAVEAEHVAACMSGIGGYQEASTVSVF